MPVESKMVAYRLAWAAASCAGTVLSFGTVMLDVPAAALLRSTVSVPEVDVASGTALNLPLVSVACSAPLGSVAVLPFRSTV